MFFKIKFHIKKNIIIIIISVLILLIACIVLFNFAILPSVMEISEATIKYMALQCMNEAISSTISGLSTYDLINISRNEAGEITMVQSNTLKINEIASKAALDTQERINSIGEQGINIPIGTVIGGPIFTGRGFPIKVDIMPIGAVSSTFRSEFTSAGINQTKHKVYLVLDATIKIVISGTGQQVKVSNEVLISESIIIGNVPNVYMQMDGSTPNILDLSP